MTPIETRESTSEASTSYQKLKNCLRKQEIAKNKKSSSFKITTVWKKTWVKNGQSWQVCIVASTKMQGLKKIEW